MAVFRFAISFLAEIKWEYLAIRNVIAIYINTALFYLSHRIRRVKPTWHSYQLQFNDEEFKICLPENIF